MKTYLFKKLMIALSIIIYKMEFSTLKQKTATFVAVKII